MSKSLDSDDMEMIRSRDDSQPHHHRLEQSKKRGVADAD